jgi:flagellar assembly protein FliH
MKSLRLEVFDMPEAASHSQTMLVDNIALEEAKLTAYDKGYRAGWDDAAQSHESDQTRIGAELARNLTALGITYAEARTHVLAAMEPVLQDIVARLLPAIARAALAPTILHSLRPLAERASDSPIEIMINPAARPALDNLLLQSNGPPLAVVEEPSLGQGQAFLRLGQSETQIDLDMAIADITAALTAFFQTTESVAPE